jgi:hypothetical protein
MLARRPRRSYLSTFMLAAFACAGCGRSARDFDASVQGTVTVDGELAHGGSVTFFPVEKGPTAVGNIAADGSYSLRVGQGNARNVDRSAIPSGDYVVTAVITGPSEENKSAQEGGPPLAGPRLVADKYASRETSDLKFTIKVGANVIVLNLEGPSANPPKDEGAQPTENANESAKPSDANEQVSKEPENKQSDSSELNSSPQQSKPAESAKPDEGNAASPVTAEGPAK